MKYTTPEILVAGSATAAVQSSNIKQNFFVPDNMSLLATTSAYEADE
jgi:hypothetical protein